MLKFKSWHKSIPKICDQFICSSLTVPLINSSRDSSNFEKFVIDRLLSPDIVQEIFLRELTLSSTLSSNPKSSHSVDPQFSHKLLFYVH